MNMTLCFILRRGIIGRVGQYQAEQCQVGPCHAGPGTSSEYKLNKINQESSRSGGGGGLMDGLVNERVGIWMDKGWNFE